MASIDTDRIYAGMNRHQSESTKIFQKTAQNAIRAAHRGVETLHRARPVGTSEHRLHKPVNVQRSIPMTTFTQKIVLTAAAIVAASVPLTACTATATHDAKATKPAATATAAPAPENPSSAPVKQFKLADGSTVAVSTDPSIPLPAPVQAAGNQVATQGVANIKAAGELGPSIVASEKVLGSQLDGFSSQTGRGAVTVIAAMRAVPGGPAKLMYSGVVVSAPGAQITNAVAASPDKAAVIAAAQSYAKSHGVDFLMPSNL